MIDLAVIGAGVMGELHGRNLSSLSGRARVSHVFDPDPGRSHWLADELNATSSPSVEAALGADNVSAVVIAVPPRAHPEILELALAYENDVLLEKPIAINRTDATTISDLLANTDRRVMVGHVLRFWPGYPELVDLVHSHQYGLPLAVTCSRMQAPPSTTGWLADPNQSGGISPLVMIHDFDLMNWVLGTPIAVESTVLRGTGSAATHVVAEVLYEGTKGLAEASTAMPKSYPFTTSVSVYCEGALLHFGYRVESQTESSNRNASQFTPSSQPEVVVYLEEDGRTERIAISAFDPWVPEISYFVDRIEKNLPIEIGTPAQALEALGVALAANTSLEAGSQVAVRDTSSNS